MADDHARDRRARLSILQRKLAGNETRSALYEHLTALTSPSVDRAWRILDLEESDELRARLLDEYRQRQSAGSLASIDADNWSALRDLVRSRLAKVSPDDSVLVHFQDSETVGLLEAQPVLLADIAVDLLQFDGDNVLLAPRDAHWGLLLDRTMEADDQERFELESWGPNAS